MKPLKTDTKVFKNGLKVTKGSKIEDYEFENDTSPMRSLIGVELQLFMGALWFAIYYYCISYGNNTFFTVLSWFALVIGSLFIILFIAMHALPAVWKWFINLV